VIEAFVPSDDHPSTTTPANTIEVKSITADRVILSVATYSGQDAEGQFVELTEGGGVRLRPWKIRAASPRELDEMAARAGLVVRERWETFAREPFGPASASHVTLYALREAPGQVMPAG
jgi:hypothetical protein